MADLLLEIFSEEIPARMQKRAGEDLKKRVTDALVEAGITYASAAAFSTPRRLTLTISDVLEASKPTKEERRGPRADAPEKAIEGFLRATGLGRDALETRETNKGDVLFAVIEKPGRKAADVIGEIVPAIIRNFPWPKSMRWGAGNLRWVRPIHSVLSILVKEDGAEIVPFDLDGIPVGNTTEGHRFMGTGRFSVASFEDYEQKLRANFVMLDPDLRAETIWHDATTAAFAQGLEVVADKGLLAEVAGLVEWPVVLMGDIAPDFMGLPVEVLQTSMREHQKFFSVKHPKTGRIEKFVTVANRETADDGATILAGNQKVLFARLSDAKFFWENDLRVPLADMAAKLSNVTFHNKLGTQAERVTRIAALAREIAPFVGADPDQAEQAAKICNNMILGITMIGTCEAFALADKLGLDRAKMFDVVSTSSGSSWTMNTYCPAPGVGPTSPADNDYQPGFAADLMLKDLRLSQTAAEAVDAATPLGQHATDLYQCFVEQEDGSGRDFSAMLPRFEKLGRH